MIARRRLLAGLAVLLACHAPMLASQSSLQVTTIPAAEGSVRENAPMGTVTRLADGRLVIMSDRLSLVDPVQGTVSEAAFGSTSLKPYPTMVVQLADQTLMAWQVETGIFQRLDLSGRRIGSHYAHPPFIATRGNHDLAASADAVVLIGRQHPDSTSFTIALVGAHGSQRWQQRIELQRADLRVALLTDVTRQRIYAVLRSGTATQWPLSHMTRIEALDLSGNRLWHWARQGSEQDTAAAMRIADSGELELVFGNGLQALSSSGQARPFQPLPGGTSVAAEQAVFDGDAWYTIVEQTAGSAGVRRYRVSRVDLDQGLQWAREFTVVASDKLTGVPLAHVDDDGRLLVALAGAPAQLTGLDRAGNEFLGISYGDADNPVDVRFLLPLASDQFAFGHDRLSADGTRHGYIDHLDVGASTRHTLAIAHRPQFPEQPAVAAFANGSAVFMAVPGSREVAARRVRLNADGSTAWSVDLPPDFGDPRAAAICGDDALCIAAAADAADSGHGSRLARFVGTQSTPAWQHAVSGKPASDNLRWIDSRLVPADNGQIVLIDDYGDVAPDNLGIVWHRAHRITRVRREGNIVFAQDTFSSEANPQAAVQVAEGANGRLAFRAGGHPSELFTLHTDGSRRSLGPADGPSASNGVGVERSLGLVFDDGSVGYPRFRGTAGFIGWESGDIHWRLARAPGVVIDVPLSTEWAYGHGAVLPSHRTHALADGDVLVLLHLPTVRDPLGIGVTQLFRTNRHGVIRWQRDWKPEGGRDMQWSVDTGGNALLSTVRDNGIWTLRLVSADGEVIRQREIDCGGVTCRIDAVSRDLDGVVTAAGRRQAPGIGPIYQVLRLSSTVPTPPAPITDRRRDGPWYSPGTDGQGLTLRLLPQADGRTTVFMPWFTFPFHEDELNPQDWVLLQGDIAPNSREATLSIYAAIDGRFPGPDRGLVLVGDATLTMPECDRALLSYRFDERWIEAVGTVALQPLLPALTDCASGGGPEPYGSDLSNVVSGLWHEPDRDGHGIDLHYLPSASGSDDVLFGAWYTYPLHASQYSHRRWFTLQSPQRDGDIIRAVIYTTLGGTLDGRPTTNHFRVGEAEMVSLACDRLQLTYRFDDKTQAGEYRGLDGQLALRRIGDCVEWPTTANN